MFDCYEYKGNYFTVWETSEGFQVTVNDESYFLNSMADVREFIQYYRIKDEI